MWVGLPTISATGGGPPVADIVGKQMIGIAMFVACTLTHINDGVLRRSV